MARVKPLNAEKAAEYPERMAAADRVIELVNDGMSQRKAIALALKELNLEITSATLHRWSKKYYVPLPTYRAFKQMAEVAQDYNATNRARVSNKIILAVEAALDAHLEDVEDQHLSPRDLKELAITFGIASDKRRVDDLPEDEEEVEPGAAREAMISKLDDLAERRKAREVTDA